MREDVQQKVWDVHYVRDDAKKRIIQPKGLESCRQAHVSGVLRQEELLRVGIVSV